MNRSRVANSLTGWLARWSPVLPLFLGETIVWTGFGALLPVLPLLTEHLGSLVLALAIGGREIGAAAPGRATTIGPAEPIRST